MSAIRGERRLIVSVLSLALASGFAIAGDSPGVATSGAATPAGPAAISRKVLNTTDVPGSNYQVIEAKVEIAANAKTPRHTHPGSVFGYLLEGDYSVELEGQARKTLMPGESFLIPAGVVHQEFAGAHAAKVVAVFTVEKGKPLTSLRE
jgi:quercetin dioxygenase-like cupin family protein